MSLILVTTLFSKLLTREEFEADRFLQLEGLKQGPCSNLKKNITNKHVMFAINYSLYVHVHIKLPTALLKD